MCARVSAFVYACVRECVRACMCSLRLHLYIFGSEQSTSPECTPPLTEVSRDSLQLTHGPNEIKRSIKRRMVLNSGYYSVEQVKLN